MRRPPGRMLHVTSERWNNPPLCRLLLSSSWKWHWGVKQVGSWRNWWTWTKTLNLFNFHRRTTSARLPARLRTSRRKVRRGNEWSSSPRARTTPWQPSVGLFFFLFAFCLLLFLFPYFCEIKKHLKPQLKFPTLAPLGCLRPHIF